MNRYSERTKILLSVGVLFFSFSMLVLFIYLAGERKHGAAPEAGLSQSVQSEILVQHMIRVDPSVRIDVTTDAPARRVQLASGGQVVINLQNLLSERQGFKIEFDLRPQAAKEAFYLSPELRLLGALQPKERQEINVPYELDSEKLRTLDGTIDLIIKILPFAG